MDFWEHRAVQGGAREQGNRRAVEQEKEPGRVRDDEDPPEEMDRTRLSPRQMLALRAFHSGASLKDTAKAAGVSRQTLHRWRTIYHSFSRAMEVWEEGQMIIARSRLVDMADNAIDALAQTIEDGNARAAMMVLRSLQILRTYAPLKPPAESAAREPRQAGFPLARDSGMSASRGRADAGIGGQDKEVQAKQANGATSAAPLSSPTASKEAGKASATKTAPAAAQHIHVTSNPPVERPITAKLTQKSGLAIKMACDSALQDVTGFYQMLHAAHG